VNETSVPGWQPWAIGKVQALLGAVFSAAASLTFVAFTGGAVLWVRARALGLPPDQVVAAVPRRELIATGASSLAIFALLGFVAVGVVYLLDKRGVTSIPTRIGLLAVVVVELVITLSYHDARAGQIVLTAAIVIATLACLLALGLVGWFSYEVDPDEKPTAPPAPPDTPPTNDIEGLLASILNSIRAWGAAVTPPSGDPPSTGGTPPLAGSVPVGERSPATTKSSKETKDRCKAKHKEPDPPPPEVRLTGLGSTLTFVVVIVGAALIYAQYEEWWLSGAFAAAFLLYLVVLAIARSSAQHFWGTAVAVMVSTGLFGAVLATLRYWDHQEVQPIAALRAGEARPVCGIYVAETDDRLYLGRLDNDDGLTESNGATGHLFWLAREDVEGWALGELQSRVDANAALPRLEARVRQERRVRTTTTASKKTVPRRNPAGQKKLSGKTSVANSGETVTTTPPEKGDAQPACTIYTRLPS
jgi:hypothetical protein